MSVFHETQDIIQCSSYCRPKKAFVSQCLTTITSNFITQQNKRHINQINKTDYHEIKLLILGYTTTIGY